MKTFFLPSVTRDEPEPQPAKQLKTVQRNTTHATTSTAGDKLCQLPPPEPIWNLPPASQIDQSILAALPQELRDEIERELRPSSPANIPISLSPNKSPVKPKLSPQKSTRGRGRGRGRGILVKKDNAQPSIFRTDFAAKRNRIDSMLQQSDRSVRFTKSWKISGFNFRRRQAQPTTHQLKSGIRMC